MRCSLRHGFALATIVAVILATSGVAKGAAWEWDAHLTVGGANVTAAVGLILSSTELNTTTRIPVPGGGAVVSPCRAKLSDVAQASAEREGNVTALRIVLRPNHPAVCSSLGSSGTIVLPADDYALASHLADTINKLSSTIAAATPAATATHALAKPTPARRAPATPAAVARTTPKPAAVARTTPRPAAVARTTPKPAAVARTTPKPAAVARTTPKPAATARAVPTPEPPAPLLARNTMSVDDWVRDHGAFAFIRLRNNGTGPVDVDGIEIDHCSNVDYGCGRLNHTFKIPPRTTVVLATVASANKATPTFSYRYVAKMAHYSYAGEGSSDKGAPPGAPAMTDDEIQASQAVALAEMRKPSAPAVTPPRLTKRGSSTLASGATGVVHVRVRVAPDGTPEGAVVVSTTNGRLTAAAIETAVSSTYEPATKNGMPIAADYVATFSFTGQQAQASNVPPWRSSPLPKPLPTPVRTPEPVPTPIRTAPPPPTPAPPAPMQPATLPQPAATP